MNLKTSLIAHWKLNETSGTRNDSHGANHLTDNNTVGSVAGKLGNAADFVRASTECLSCVDNDSLSTGDIDFTLACWVKFNDSVGFYDMLQKGVDDGYGEYRLWYDPANAEFRFAIANSSANRTTFSISATVGVWYFVVAWYDSGRDLICLQVNAGTPTTASSAGNTTTTGTFKMGTSGGDYHNGSIDSVSYWKRVLTSAERRALYNSGNGLDYNNFTNWDGTLKQDLISHWKLEEASGTRSDTHGSQDLTDVNTVGNAVGKIGNAASFIRTNNEYLSIATPESSLQVQAANDWSFAFWFKVNNTGDTAFRLAQWTGAAVMRLNTFGAGVYFLEVIFGSFCTGPNLSLGVWNFAVIKFNALTNTVSIRINNGTAITTVVVTPVTGTSDMLISAGIDPCDGLIDSVSFWARELTSDEETTLYNAGAGLDYDAFVSGNVTFRRRIILL